MSRTEAPAADGRFISVATKLMVATACVVVLVTAVVYFGLTRFEREKMIGAKEQAARMANELFLRQASTPVIFDDATGIHDTVALLAQDPEVLGVELWRAGEGHAVGARIAAELKQAGPDSTSSPTPPRFVEAPVIERQDDRIVLRDAVRDQDRKIIALAAVQYSLARENAAYQELSRQILMAAFGVALLLALLLMLVSRRWIMTPLARLLRSVKRMEAGKGVSHDAVAANDEVGRLAQAFVRMAAVVQERERDIARRNDDMRLVLGNVGQGFLVIDPQGRIAAERSAIVDRWFGAPAPGQTIDEYLAPIGEEFALMLGLGLQSVRDGFMPLEVTVSQLPRRLRHGGRHYDCDYHPVLTAAATPEGEAALASLVLVISDVSSEVERQWVERTERDLIAAVSRMVSDRASFAEFRREAGALVERLEDRERPLPAVELLRDLHTLKGISGLFGLAGLAGLCHEVEQGAADAGGDLGAEDRARVGAWWREIEGKLKLFTGGERQAIELDAGEHAALVAAAAARAPHAQIAALLARLLDEPVRPRLQRLGDHAALLAERLGKCALSIELAGDGLRLPREPWSGLWPLLGHLVKNAVDHGLESADERAAAGKPLPAHLRLAVEEAEDGAVTISVGDDGRGVDWDALARKAEALGLPHATRDDLVAALFADGLSTREEATEISGRGVGLAAVRSAVEGLGGQVVVQSAPGAGARFELRFPGRDGLRQGVRRAS